MLKSQKRSGGARKGSGRKRNAAAMLTQEAADRIFRDGITPLEFMVNLMREPKPKRGRGESEGNYGLRIQNWQRQCFEAAKAAAPYIHPRLQAVEHSSSTDDDPTDRCIRVEVIGRMVKKLIQP